MHTGDVLDQPAGGLVVLAVDDEPPALEELAHQLGRDERVREVLAFGDARRALDVLTRARQAGRTPDAVFMDIRMPGMSGLELAEAFGELDDPPPVVFVTADDSRAVEAFDVGAIDYLLKPLRPAHVTRSLDRVVGQAASERRDEVLPVELGGVTSLVRRSEVRYVEASGDYVRLHTATGSHLARIPLGALDERWSDAGFFRIHRSYLVALAHVRELTQVGEHRAVRVDAGRVTAELPVSRRNLRRLRRRLRGGWDDDGGVDDEVGVGPDGAGPGGEPGGDGPERSGPDGEGPARYS